MSTLGSAPPSSPFGATAPPAGIHETPLGASEPASPDAQQFRSHGLSISILSPFHGSAADVSGSAGRASPTTSGQAHPSSSSAMSGSQQATSPAAAPPLHGYLPNTSPWSHHDRNPSDLSASSSRGPLPSSVHTNQSPSVDHEPDTGIDMSQHTTPGFEDDSYVDNIFKMMTNLKDDDGAAPPAGGDTVSPTVATEAKASSNVSPSTGRPRGGTSSSSYLLSPVNTNSPSPPTRSDVERIGDDDAAGEFVEAADDPVGAPNPTAHPNSLEISSQDIQMQTPQTRSGGNSANGDSGLRRSRSNPHHGRPEIRIERQGGGATSLQRNSSSPGLSKRTRPELPSPTHLSPPVDDYGYGSDDPASDSNPSDVPGAVRADDGSWIPSAVTGQGGVDPNERRHVQDVYVPSLKEQEQQRELEEKKADVEVWIFSSTASSVPAERGAPSPRSSPRMSLSTPGGRRRFHTAGEATLPKLNALGLDVNGIALEDDGIPGPGVLVHEESDDGLDDGDAVSDGRTLQSSPPASHHEEEEGEYQTPTVQSPTAAALNSPGLRELFHVHPWDDCPSNAKVADTRAQPPTANAAIMRFQQRAENLETASRMATWGTRRMSDSDVERIASEGTLLKRLSLGREKDKEREKEKEREKDKHRNREDKNSLSEIKRLFSKRSLKRKGSDKTPSEQEEEQAEKGRADSLPGLVLTRTESSGSKPSRPSTGATITAAIASQLAAVGGGGATAVATTPSLRAQAKDVFRRSRSKSDVSRKSDSKEAEATGISSLMAHHGGPPVPTLGSASPREEAVKPPHASDEDEDDNDEDEAMEGDGVEMDLNVKSAPTRPTLDGFRLHVQQLNPRMMTFLVERISQEQVKRFKKLIEMREKHQAAIRRGQCSSGNRRFCVQLGGQPTILPMKPSPRDSSIGFSGFQVSGPISTFSNGASESRRDPAVSAAQFPRGVPAPPVARLPAEFECSLCFKVKKFQKPSDWTKHVHEDVQPFTCTFPHCQEPKSFKRKADWVRHENERHRHLEWWTCNLPECNHTCYRRDNFVQHLVREHKKPEPKLNRASKTASRSPAGHGFANGAMRDVRPGETDQVSKLVEECRHEAQKLPRDEPCKFCGNICSSWKKLTVHLARHLEQISLPVLQLVDQHFAGEGSANAVAQPTQPPPPQQQQQQQQQQQRPSERQAAMPPPASMPVKMAMPRAKSDANIKMEPSHSGVTMLSLLGSMPDLGPVSNYGLANGNASYPTTTAMTPPTPAYGFQNAAYATHNSPPVQSPQHPQPSRMANYGVGQGMNNSAVYASPSMASGVAPGMAPPNQYAAGYGPITYTNGIAAHPSGLPAYQSVNEEVAATPTIPSSSAPQSFPPLYSPQEQYMYAVQPADVKPPAYAQNPSTGQAGYMRGPMNYPYQQS